VPTLPEKFGNCVLGISVALLACSGCGSSGTGSEPATLTGLTLAPDTATVAVGLDRQVVATASYSDHSSVVRTTQATWSSTAPAIATVSGGLVTGVSAGKAGIVASYGGITDTAAFTVTSTQPTMVAVRVSPKTDTVTVSGTRAIVAKAHFSDSSTTTVTSLATWTSTATSVASVSSSGLVTGVSAGTAKVIASYNGFADTNQTTVTATAPSGYVYPLKLGPTGRYLVDQNGKPFLMVGDAAWSLISQLSDQDADTYLASRAQAGFSLVLVNLIEHKFAANAPGGDSYGIKAFTGDTFSTPNDAYFAHVDHIVQSAATNGLVVLLAPGYTGYSCDDEGWANAMSVSTDSAMTVWGQYIGARYKNFDNIIWLVGGDANPGSCGVSTRLQAMVNGIQQNDTRHLFTAHNQPESMAIDDWSGANWLTINDVYTYSTSLYTNALTAYRVSPAMPYFLIETAYENDEHSPSAQQLRAQTYWTILSGGFGQVYGNCPMWYFDAPAGSSFCSATPWQNQLTSQGAINMTYVQKIFSKRHWHLLVPDTNNTVLTAGTGTSGGSDYATGAYASDGSSIVIYMPSQRQVTVNGSLLGATMNAYWYNPGTGISSSAGSGLSTASPQNFTPPSGGDGDWVLLLDNPSFGFGAP